MDPGTNGTERGHLVPFPRKGGWSILKARLTLGLGVKEPPGTERFNFLFQGSGGKLPPFPIGRAGNSKRRPRPFGWANILEGKPGFSFPFQGPKELWEEPGQRGNPKGGQEKFVPNPFLFPKPRKVHWTLGIGPFSNPGLVHLGPFKLKHWPQLFLNLRNGPI